MAAGLPDLRDAVVAAGRAGLGEMCDRDLDNLERWRFNLTEEDHKCLAEAGRREHRELGRRWRRRLPGLLGEAGKDGVEVRATYKQRTRESAASFLEGVYDGEEVDFPQNIAMGKLLSFYELCPAYMDGVDGNNETLAELFRLRASPDYTDMVETVGRRAGLGLTGAEVELVWAMCR